jgi:hypothetical protein
LESAIVAAVVARLVDKFFNLGISRSVLAVANSNAWRLRPRDDELRLHRHLRESVVRDALAEAYDVDPETGRYRNSDVELLFSLAGRIQSALLDRAGTAAGLIALICLALFTATTGLSYSYFRNHSFLSGLFEAVLALSICCDAVAMRDSKVRPHWRVLSLASTGLVTGMTGFYVKELPGWDNVLPGWSLMVCALGVIVVALSVGVQLRKTERFAAAVTSAGLIALGASDFMTGIIHPTFDGPWLLASGLICGLLVLPFAQVVGGQSLRTRALRG